MHAYDVLAYAYDAAEHCPSCARARFGTNERGFVPEDATDSEGNHVHPLFAYDEWYDTYYLEFQTLTCDTCGDELDAYTPDYDEDEDEDEDELRPSCVACTRSWANLCPRDRAGLDRNSAECEAYTELPFEGQTTLKGV